MEYTGLKAIARRVGVSRAKILWWGFTRGFPVKLDFVGLLLDVYDLGLIALVVIAGVTLFFVWR